jgi:hypothetical protein
VGGGDGQQDAARTEALKTLGAWTSLGTSQNMVYLHDDAIDFGSLLRYFIPLRS